MRKDGFKVRVTIRFLADEDVDTDIVERLRSRELAIDILDVKSAGLRGTSDPALLEIADRQDRILITHDRRHDRRTMTRHFYECAPAGKAKAGVIHPSAAERSRRGDSRSPASYLDGIGSGRVAESSRIFALPLKRAE
jgi:hypothetical protein